MTSLGESWVTRRVEGGHAAYNGGRQNCRQIMVRKNALAHPGLHVLAVVAQPQRPGKLRVQVCSKRCFRPPMRERTGEAWLVNLQPSIRYIGRAAPRVGGERIDGGAVEAPQFLFDLFLFAHVTPRRYPGTRTMDIQQLKLGTQIRERRKYRKGRDYSMCAPFSIKKRRRGAPFTRTPGGAYTCVRAAIIHNVCLITR